MRVALAKHDIQAVFRLLQRHGMSQRAIARVTGQSQGEISEIMSGRRQIQGYDMFVRIADGFRLPRGWLGVGYDAETAAWMDEHAKAAIQRPPTRPAPKPGAAPAINKTGGLPRVSGTPDHGQQPLLPGQSAASPMLDD
jgi:transcriptional regulator with XRE-family HTH domain